MAQTIGSDDLGKDNTKQPGNLDDNQPGAGPNSSTQQSAGGGSQAPTVQASNAAPVNPNQQKGSGYTNIQKVISANQGNKLGQAVGSGVQQAGQGLQSNLGQAQNQFQQQTQQNQFNTDANKQLVNNVLATPDQYGNLGQNNANSQAGGKFGQLMSGTYQGPNNLQNASQLQGQAQDVGQLNKALGNQAGQAGLLQRFVGNPQYSQGQQNLDQLLLGQTGGKDLAAARTATAGLGSKVNNALLGAQAQGQQATNEAQLFGRGVQDQFGNTVSGIDTGLQGQAKTAQSARDTSYQNTLKALQSGQVSQKQADLLGLTGGQEVTQNALQGVGSYLTENPLQANAQNVAGQQDYARINALRTLAGQNVPTGAQDILQKYSEQDKNAGAFNAAPDYTADKTGFGNVLSGQLQGYHSQIDPASAAAQASAAKVASYAAHQNLGGLGGAIARSALAGAQQENSRNQSNYQNILNAVNSSTGGLKNIQITPEQVANEQQKQDVAAGNAVNFGLENAPKVT